MYSGQTEQILEGLKIKPGDFISYSKGSLSISGMLMPNSDAGDGNCLKLKLSSGYNVGVLMDGAKIKKEKEGELQSNIPPSSSAKQNGQGRKISLITTGGTIASKVDHKTGAVSAKINASDFLSMYDGLDSLANIEVRPVMNVLSENMGPNDWATIAKEAKAAADGGAEGIVITHGTDTMGYTAAALSYALDGIGIPVIITGSQRSLDRPSSDAHQNMKCSIHAALSNFCGVYVCMHASTNDDFNHLHIGTRVRKTHTSGRWAFKSIGVPPVAKIFADSRIEFIAKSHQKRQNSQINLKCDFSQNVHFAWVYPGIKKEEVLSWSKFEGVLLAGTGFGHISKSVHEALAQVIKGGTIVAMASQCGEGRTMLQTYSTGRQLEDIGAIGNGADWLAESAFVKLCWALAQTKDAKKAKDILMRPIAGDLNEYSYASSGED